MMLRWAYIKVRKKIGVGVRYSNRLRVIHANLRYWVHKMAHFLQQGQSFRPVISYRARVGLGIHEYVQSFCEATSLHSSFTNRAVISRYTVFPRNLAAATFNFVVQFGAATFRGRPDFEGGD